MLKYVGFKRKERLKNMCGTTPVVAMLAIDTHGADVIGTHSAISSVYLKRIYTQICTIACLLLFTYNSKMGSDSNYSLSESEFDYDVDGYTF